MVEEDSEKKRDGRREERDSEKKGFNYEVSHSLRKLAATLVILLVLSYFLRNTFWVYGTLFIIAIVVLKAVWGMISPFLPDIIVKGIPFLFTLAIIGGIIWVASNLIISGGESGFFGVAGAKIESSGAAKAFNAWAKEIGFFAQNPDQLLSSADPFAAPPKSAEDVPTKGILFESVSSRKTQYVEGETIIVEGDVNVIALKDHDTKVKFYCSINQGETNKTGALTLAGILGTEIVINAGQDETLHYLCKFDGVELNLSKEERTNKKEDIRFLVATIFGEYQDFTTTSLLRVYTLQDDLLTQIKAQGKEPFENIDDPFLDKKEGVTKAQCVYGCGLTRLSMQTQKQPQTEVTPYSLRLALRKDRDYYGDIIKVEKIELALPQENFELISCDNFGGDTVLDSSDDYWSYFNKEIIEESFGQATEFDFYCEYKVTRPALKVIFSELKADATYDYRVSTTKKIEIKEGKLYAEGGYAAQNNQQKISDSNDGYVEADYYNVG